jgi:hypothetical protein
MYKNENFKFKNNYMKMTKPLIDLQAIKTILQGALGALIFTVYNEVTNNKIKELQELNKKLKEISKTE